MAEQDGSAATLSSTPNFWDLHTISSWNNVLPWHPLYPNSNYSSCEEEITISNSFTNISNHSGLTNEASRLDHHLNAPPPSTSNDLTGIDGLEPMSENHLWSQVVLNVGSTGDLHGSQDVGENFLEALSSNILLTTDMFEPACDYSNTASFNNVEKLSNSSAFNGRLLQHENQKINLSNLAGNWSTALPLPAVEANRHIKNINSIDHKNQFSESTDLSHDQMKLQQEYHTSNNSVGIMNGFFPCYGHQEIHHEHSFEALFLRSCGSQMAAGDPNNKYYNELLDALWSNSNNTNNLSDIISFNGGLLDNKPMVGIQSPNKHSLKASLPQMNNKKHGQDSTSLLPQIKGSGRGSRGKKICDDNSEKLFKKPKHDSSSSTVLSGVKVQATEELRKRVASLHEIVSPFRKNDRASVLQDAIAYIKFLQEQVQQLSNPYMKANMNKVFRPKKNMNKDSLGLLLESSSNGKERDDGKTEVFDLKCKGLCLVPVSCIPQVYRENTGGSDFWTTTYSGSLYR